MIDPLSLSFTFTFDFDFDLKFILEFIFRAAWYMLEYFLHIDRLFSKFVFRFNILIESLVTQVRLHAIELPSHIDVTTMVRKLKRKSEGKWIS